MTVFAEYEPGAARSRAAVGTRVAVADDVADIVAIKRRAGRAARADGYRRALADADQRQIVATRARPAGAPTVVGWAQTCHHTEVMDAAPAGYYLAGVTVDPPRRRRGIAVELTKARIAWIAERTDEVFYVVNPRNPASIDLHRRWSFEEVTRGPRLTGITFDGGVGIVMRAGLRNRGAGNRDAAPR